MNLFRFSNYSVFPVRTLGINLLFENFSVNTEIMTAHKTKKTGGRISDDISATRLSA
jgi:hypothetical protein